jgi:hypothetical protein
MTLRLLGLLLAGGLAACASPEAQCHQRAIALLGCCPFCDANCDVSKDPDAKFAEDACLADLAEQQQENQPPAGSEDGTSGDAGETTSGQVW